ncbi:MAG: UDP-glucose/GDP-mannose dehydrogenase family protein [Acidimicrobiia bacterium]|nr:UDP-glucose/GDP-mannose dehydrogenase family protein [Acidimicrobiia bacterium]
MQVTVVGLGYVGLVTGTCLAKVGHRVRCVDVDSDRVRSVQGGTAPFYEPGIDSLLGEVIRNGALEVSGDLRAALEGSDVSIIAVGTPSDPNGSGRIDLSYVKSAARQIGECLRGDDRYHVVVVKSTVVPGTTDTDVRRAVEEGSRRKCGDIGLCMNPEFLREGAALSDFMNPDRIVIGEFDAKSGAMVAGLYETFQCPIVRTTLRNAELIKYSSNSLLALLISYSNELAGICERTPGTDIDVVIRGLGLDRRLSPAIKGVGRVTPEILSYLRAGIGFGGSCLPKDVSALRAFAKARQAPTDLIDAVLSVNARRSSEIARLLGPAMGNQREVAVLGLAFKPGTDDLRDSPALALCMALSESGWHVRGYDPKFPSAGAFPYGRLCASLDDAVELADAAVLATAWPEFVQADWRQLASRMRRPLIVDGRNALKEVVWPDFVDYRPIGVARDRTDGIA